MNIQRNKYWVTYLCALILSTGAESAFASFITSSSAFSGLSTTTVTFEDLTGVIGQQFGFGAGQPYTGLGLTMGPEFVSINDIGSVSGNISAESSTVYSVLNDNYQHFLFSTPEMAVGFFYQDLTATSITFTALNSQRILEEFTLTGGPGVKGYAGFLRSSADITEIRISAPHVTAQDAFASRLYTDDISFASTAVPLPAAVWLLGSGLVGLLGVTGKRKVV